MPRTLDDLDDDLNLPQRGRRPDTREDISREMSHDADREFTLSTGTVLVLFFTLALICAVFFGFGYSMGRKSVKTTETANVAVPDTAPPPDDTAGKPSAATPAASVPSYQADASSTTSARASTAVKTTASSDGSRVTIATVPVAPTAPTPVRTGSEPPVVTATKPAATPAAPATTQPAPALASSSDPAAVYVQIAAVSHQEDANVLLSALKRRGYSVFTRTSPADKLIHVQVGPYSGKKDAEVMRQRLLGDGYNAILK